MEDETEFVEDTNVDDRDAIIEKLTEERDNYKKVALKRLGKLPGDKQFIGAEDDDRSIDEIVKEQLYAKEVERADSSHSEEVKRVQRENAELRIALKHQPQQPLGGDSGTSKEVADGVFSTEQIAELRKRAERVGVDPEKFIENTKKNLQR